MYKPVRTLFQTSQLPIFGICLGHQLVALAAGARTIKLKVSKGVKCSLFLDVNLQFSTGTAPTIFLV